MAESRWELDLSEISFGQKGGVVVSSTTGAASTGKFGALNFLSSATINSITIAGVTDSTLLTTQI